MKLHDSNSADAEPGLPRHALRQNLNLVILHVLHNHQITACNNCIYWEWLSFRIITATNILLS